MWSYFYKMGQYIYVFINSDNSFNRRRKCPSQPESSASKNVFALYPKSGITEHLPV